MRYLIISGCGFLGSNLAHEVLTRGEELCVFDNLFRLDSVENLAWLRRTGEFEFRHGDIRSQDDVVKTIATFGPDAIFHLAGQVAMTTSIANPRLYFEVNALGTFNLLEAVRQHVPETIVIYSSTNKVYGDRQFATYDQGWIGWFCQKAIETKKGILTEPFIISGSGKQVRDVLHAEDMKKLYFTAVDQIDHARGQSFNIGGGMKNSLSLLELFALLEELLDVRLAYTKTPWRQSDQKVFVANTRKAMDLIGWDPRVDKNSSIKMMLDWLRDNL